MATILETTIGGATIMISLERDLMEYGVDLNVSILSVAFSVIGYTLAILHPMSPIYSHAAINPAA